MTIVFQSSPIQSKISNPLCLLVWISPLPLSSPFYLLSRLPQKYLLIQLRLTGRLLHFYNLLKILQLLSPTSLLPPQLDYSSKFRSVKTINLDLQTDFLRLITSYLTFDPFSRTPSVSNFSQISLFLDANIAVNISQITHAEQNDPAWIGINNSLKHEFSTWEIILWYSRRQEYTIQSTSLSSQRLVVAPQAITAFPR